MKKYFLLITVVLFSLVSCETIELNKDLQSPNDLTLDQADPDKLLNSVQFGVSDFYRSASIVGMNLTRMAQVSGGASGATYANFVTPNDFYTDRMWQSYYSIIGRAENLRIKTAGLNYNQHDGISQVIEAYALITLVDYFGDIPLTQALQGNNLNPTRDTGASVYTYALDLLAKAKVNFSASPIVVPKIDIFYPTSATVQTPVKTKWVKLINSLMFKAYLNTGNTGMLNTLISENNFIGANEDFVFKFGSQVSNPDTRNQFFTDNYAQAPQDYMATSFLWTVTQEKGVNVDPRRRYYFFRQVASVVTNPSEIPCSSESFPSHYPAGTPFCFLPNGYWGRDHGNNDGIPPDTGKRTVWGVYPFGGKFDADNASSVGVTSGQAGVGVYPLLLSNYVDFMKAEACLRFGTSGDAKTNLLTGIDNNLNYVKNLFSQTSPLAMSTTDISGYKTLVDGLYTSAMTTDTKLAVLIKEYYIASFGNGIEAYNAYRRTGYPKNLQPMLQATPGDFPRSILYPTNHTANNSNAPQKPNNNVRVFWDTGSHTLN
jgi:Starch-binding associating with outer membrane/Susd and RagB outer membrane lipoprotein